jgi:hypothetical protein
LLFINPGCVEQQSRQDSIDEHDIKYTPEMDLYPPVIHSNEWADPIPMPGPVNTARREDACFITPNGDELWFTRESSKEYPSPVVYRSIKDEHGNWSSPEEIVSNFAGEPTLDAEGNLYFVHHFFDEQGTMVEADIYECYTIE